MKARPRTGQHLEIVLSRESPVSLHNQLVTQISLNITNGVLKPGERLPSVRALARRLKIHHNTVSAAYGELADHLLVEIRHGSGVYVSETEADETQLSELDGIIRAFFETARRKGYALHAIRQGLMKWLLRQPPDRLLIIEPAKDLQKILIHELSKQLNCPINAATIQEVMAQPELLNGALALVTAYHASEVKRLLPSDTILIPLNLQTGREEAEKLKRLPLGAMVGLVSIGSTMIDYARVVIASLRGEQLLVRTELFSDSEKWRSLARTADLMITDSCCFDTVSRFSTRTAIKISLLSPPIVRYLRATLRNLNAEEGDKVASHSPKVE